MTNNMEEAAMHSYKAELDSLADGGLRQTAIAFTLFYASFFALWAFSGDLLSNIIYLISGGLMLVSIGFFGLTLIIGILAIYETIDSINSRFFPLLARRLEGDEELPSDAFQQSLKDHVQATIQRLGPRFSKSQRITKVAMVFAVAAIIFLLASYLITVATALSAQAQQAEQVAYAAEEPTLADLRFMVGHWKAEGAGPEEIWTAPARGVMSGMMRWASAGGSGRYVLELLTMVEEEAGIRFYFKHFDTDITPWEKNEANTYELVALENECARFELVNENPRVAAVQQYCRLDATTLEFRGTDRETPLAETDFVLTFKLQGGAGE